MQYILTQEELDDLKSRKSAHIAMETGKLQALCTKIAVEMPVKVHWRNDAFTWGCILDKDSDGDPSQLYCDECPVQTICPCECKEWSQ